MPGMDVRVYVNIQAVLHTVDMLTCRTRKVGSVKLCVWLFQVPNVVHRNIEQHGFREVAVLDLYSL